MSLGYQFFTIYNMFHKYLAWHKTLTIPTWYTTAVHGLRSQYMLDIYCIDIIDGKICNEFCAS